jgi:hypothetical protein
MLNLNRVASRVKSPKDVPNGKHFAILIFTESTVHVPGDERSRTCPGHGYPAHDETTESYEYWYVKDENNLKTAIQMLEDEKKSPYSSFRAKYQVVEVKPVNVKCTVEIELG